MPITPRFVLSQTSTHVLVTIRVPHVRVSTESVQVVLQDATMHFASPPYLLVLTFPYAPVPDSETAKYDPSRDGGVVEVELRKAQPDVHWADLDLLANLVTKRRTNDGTASAIAATGASTARMLKTTIVSEERHSDDDDDDADKETDQDENKAKPDCGNKEPLPSLLGGAALMERPRYGFMDMFEGIYTDLTREGMASEMLALPNPDETTSDDRRRLRQQSEEETFDGDRYLGDVDVQDDYLFQVAMAMEPHWSTKTTKATRSSDTVESLTEQMADLKATPGRNEGQTDSHQQAVGDGDTFFTESERLQMASIPYPLLSETKATEQQQQQLLLGLLDILFAYVYDHLLTDGDPTIESAWAISTLSCQLSWLDGPLPGDSIEMAICHSLRRVMIYPYLRNYDFGMHCWQQVSAIVTAGRRCTIRCLLQTRRILHESELYYFGNKLFVDPYLVWIQRQVSDAELVALLADPLGGALSRIETSGETQGKAALGLGLMELERSLFREEESIGEDEGENNDDESDTNTNTSESSDESVTDSNKDSASESDECNDRGTGIDHKATNDEGKVITLRSTELLSLEDEEANVPCLLGEKDEKSNVPATGRRPLIEEIS